MTMLEQMAADVENVEPDMPVTFTFKGRDWTGQRPEVPDGQEFMDAGILPKCDFPLLVRRQIFSDADVSEPVRDDEIHIDGKDYRVDRITNSQEGICALYSLMLLV